MKNAKLYIAILLTSLVFASGVFADVKIKSKQTAGGQTFENTTYIKGKRQRIEQNMGGMKIVNLTQCDLKRGVQINEQLKTYLIDSYLENTESSSAQKVSAGSNDKVLRAGGTVTSTVTYKDTGETRKMFGYLARHIITTMETSSSPDSCSMTNSKMQIDGWYIDASFALDCETDKYRGGYTIPERSGCQDKYQMKTIGNAKRGFPVYEKMSMLDEKGNETFSNINEVVELSQADLDTSLFEISSDLREVKSSTELYSAANFPVNSANSDVSDGNPTSGTLQNIKSQSQTSDPSSTIVGVKKEGTVRVGISVKTGSVGEGLNAGELTAAVQNTLGEYLKGTKVELVPLEAKLSSAIESEAKEKECDLVLYANVSHKKGGGGFGMFSKVIAPAIGQTGIGHTGSTAGNVAGQVATRAVVSAGSVAGNTKAKDEISLDVKLQNGSNSVFGKQYKAKARSNGEDLLSPMIEQIAEAIMANSK